MLKAVFIASLAILVTLGCMLAFRSLDRPGEEEEGRELANPVPRVADGDGRNDMPDKNTVIVDDEAVITNLSHYPKSFRQQARALIATVKASEEEIQVAQRDVDVAKIDLTQAMSEVEMLQQSVREAESDVSATRQESKAEWAAWRAQMSYANQMAGRAAALGVQVPDAGQPPLHADKAVRDAERRLETAKQKYVIQHSQAIRRIDQARLRVGNSEKRVASPKAAWERAKAELFENLLRTEMPK